MKSMIMLLSMFLLRCCWGPSDYQIIQMQQNDDTLLKELNGRYNITTLKYDDVSAYKLNITFNDSTKEVSGFSGCNRFFGSYTLDKNSLKFSPLGATKMLCNEDTNQIESSLLKTFEKANLVLFTNNGFSFYNKKKLLLSAVKKLDYEDLKLEYSAISRSTYKQISITKKTISVRQKRKVKGLESNCKEDDWYKIIETIKPVDIKNISNVESPSKAFQYDAAPLARLKIIYGGKTYESVPFDHGNPPKEIAELVKVILSISENIE